MNAARVGVDVILQRVRVGGFKLAELTPVQNAARQFVFGRKVFEHVSAGCIGAGLALFAAFDAHLVKEDFTQLGRAADVERCARHFVNLRLKPGHFLGEGVGHRLRRRGHLDAVPLHLGQHGHQRAFQRFIDAGDVCA